MFVVSVEWLGARYVCLKLFICPQMDHLDSLFDSEYVFTYQAHVRKTNIRCAVILSVMYKLKAKKVNYFVAYT